MENDSTSSLLSLGPKSASKFAGVCYDGAAGDGVLCCFQKFTRVWCLFFWIFKGFNQVFFSSIAPRDTTRWHKHYAKMMGEKERLTWNLMQFGCIFFVSLWGIHSSDFPGFYDGFIPIHPVHQDIAAQGLPRHLGLVEKDRTKWANFVELVGRCGRGTLTFMKFIEWIILEGWEPFFLGVQTSLIWLNFFVWNDAGRWWIFLGGMSGNS